ncbi:hypothetical protein Hte_009611 [Hypoxylon texense]
MATISRGSGRLRGIGSGSKNWEHFIELLDGTLAKAIGEDGVKVVTLTSLPGIGKNTALIRHIWDQARAGKAPRKVVYVVVSDTEALLLQKWMLDSKAIVEEDMGDGKALSDNPFTLCSLRECFQALQEKAWDTDRTVIVDVNWYPTVREEIAFGHFRSWVRGVTEAAANGNRVHVAIILLMSTFESERTTVPFHEMIIMEMMMEMMMEILPIDVTHWPYPALQVEPLEAGWKEKAGEIV